MRLRNLYIIICLLLSMTSFCSGQVIAQSAQMPSRCGVKCDPKELVCEITGFTITNQMCEEDLTYTSQDPDIATIDLEDGEITPQRLGTTTIYAHLAESKKCKTATAACMLLVVPKPPIQEPKMLSFDALNQEFEFEHGSLHSKIPIPELLKGKVTYKSDDPSICNVTPQKSDSSIHYTMASPGNVGQSTKITAVIADSPQRETRFTCKIVKATQQLSFPFGFNPVSCTQGKPCVVGAASTSLSNLPIRYSVANSQAARCTIQELLPGSALAQVIYQQAGNCTIQATQDGDENHTPGQAVFHTIEMK